MQAGSNPKLLAALAALAIFAFLSAIYYASQQPWYRTLPEDIKNQLKWERPKWMIQFGSRAWWIVLPLQIMIFTEGFNHRIPLGLMAGLFALMLCPILGLGAWAITKAIRTHVSLYRTHPDAGVRTFAAWSLAAYAFISLMLGGVVVVTGIAYWG